MQRLKLFENRGNPDVTGRERPIHTREALRHVRFELISIKWVGDPPAPLVAVRALPFLLGRRLKCVSLLAELRNWNASKSRATA